MRYAGYVADEAIGTYFGADDEQFVGPQANCVTLEYGEFGSHSISRSAIEAEPEAEWNDALTERESRYVVSVDDNGNGYLEDPTVTRRYHARLLNVYRKAGVLACGSVRIATSDQGVSGTCVKCKVTARLAYDGLYGDYSYDRLLMEKFTLWVIAHGNNHAAKWSNSGQHIG